MGKITRSSLKNADGKVKNYIDRCARKMLESKSGVVDYRKIAQSTNNKFGTSYSVYSIAARCGNTGLNNQLA